MKLEQLAKKKILIIGYGVEGKATHALLKKRFPTSTIGIADQSMGTHYLDKQKNYDIAIKSPGIHSSKITIPFTTATNIFFANAKGITIGVTGTKGKSTTASLLYSILKMAGKDVHLLGNITHKQIDLGKPLITALDKPQSAETIYVCELSSQQLADLEYAPHISVFTNFFPEHMDFHGSVESYWEAKKKIVAYAKKDNFFVYNPKFPILAKLAQDTSATPLPFIEALSFPKKIIPLLGTHNTENVKAAVTVAKILNIPEKIIKAAVTQFKSLPHRLENIGTYNGITFYDDAISTTPQSTIEALKAIANVQTIFLGGQDRGYDFTDLAKMITKKKIKNIVLFPDSGKTILALLISNIKYQISNILETSDMEEAVRFAYTHTKKGEVVLLSTASPSYSVWKNFEEKGNLFKQYVQQYGKSVK